MALLDVSDLLTDPDFVDVVQVKRTNVTVGTGGIVNKVVQIIPDILMNVQPASGDDLTVVPEGMRVAGMMKTFSQFELRPAIARNGTKGTPDIVVWNNEEWRVIVRLPWTNYGNGYTSCIIASTSVLPLQ